MTHKNYLVMDDPPFETDDALIVLERFRSGIKIYKPVYLGTVDELMKMEV